ncbi:MAG: methyltransferase domain-containing protein [Rhizobiales bacterium]|nr:methyltransferase domain-containing protein [Hyphomicrobiales bacterium]
MAANIPGFFQGTEMPTAGWWEALWPDPAGVLAAVWVKPGMEVIDLCSGDGWFTLQLAKVARHLIAIDIDPNLLEVARHRLVESGVTNCSFVAGDAYELAKMVPRLVDFVFMANAFHGVPDRPRLSRAVRGVLKPGGQFAIVNWHQRPREETMVLGEPRGPKTELRLSPEQTIEAVETSGLKLSHLVDLALYHYGAVFEQPHT